MKRTVLAVFVASLAATVFAHPHFNKTITAKLPSGADVTITYNTTPSNEMHAANAKVGEFVTPRAPKLKLSAEVKSGATAIPAGEYTIGVIKTSDKDWTMAWSAASWIKNFPHANAATSFDFKPGEPGKLTLEFWITPYDYAGPEGPQRAIESVLRENKIIGLGWIIIDYDDVTKRDRAGFWNLSKSPTAFGDASALPAFRLMPLETPPALQAQWSFQVLDMDRRLVAFKDETIGTATAWHWDFGDGTSSTEQNPSHAYRNTGNFVVVLDVEGPAGKSRRSKVWDVQVK